MKSLNFEEKMFGITHKKLISILLSPPLALMTASILKGMDLTNFQLSQRTLNNVIKIWTVWWTFHWVDIPFLKKNFDPLYSVRRGCIVILKNYFLSSNIFSIDGIRKLSKTFKYISVMMIEVKTDIASNLIIIWGCISSEFFSNRGESIFFARSSIKE